MPKNYKKLYFMIFFLYCKIIHPWARKWDNKVHRLAYLNKPVKKSCQPKSTYLEYNLRNRIILNFCSPLCCCWLWTCCYCCWCDCLWWWCCWGSLPRRGGAVDYPPDSTTRPLPCSTLWIYENIGQVTKTDLTMVN